MTTAEINARAARDFYGPAVYSAPRVVDVGEHKLEAWQLRVAPAEKSAAKPRTAKPKAARSTTPIIRERRPFGYKPIRKGRPVRPDMYAPDFDGRYTPSVRADELTGWKYDNRWAS